MHVTERFIRPEHRRLAAFDADAATLLERLEGFTAPTVSKWADR